MKPALLPGIAPKSQKGVALVAVLLLLALMSAMAVALVYKVNHEQHLQAADSGNTAAYYGAEAGMEKMMADLSLLYTQVAAPTTCDIANLQNAPPPQAAVGSTYPEYVFTVPGANPRQMTLKFNPVTGSIRGRIVPANPLSLPTFPPGVTGIFGSHVVAVDAESGAVMGATMLAGLSMWR